MPSVRRELNYALNVSKGTEPGGRGNSPDTVSGFKICKFSRNSKAAGSLSEKKKAVNITKNKSCFQKSAWFSLLLQGPYELI